MSGQPIYYHLDCSLHLPGKDKGKECLATFIDDIEVGRAIDLVNRSRKLQRSTGRLTLCSV